MLHQFIKSLLAIGIVVLAASCAPRELAEKPVRLEKKKEKELKIFYYLKLFKNLIGIMRFVIK